MNPQDFGPDQLKQTIFDILDSGNYYSVYLYYTQFTNEENDYLIKIFKEDKDPEDESIYTFAKYNLTYNINYIYYRLENLLDTQELIKFLDNTFMQSSNIRIEQHTLDGHLINIVYPFDDKRKNEELGGSSSKKPRTVFGKKSKNCLKHLNCDIIYLNGI